MFRTIRWTTRMRVLLAAIAAMAVGSAAYGFTAANTVPGTNAGDGSGTISGDTVSNVHYTLSGTNATGVSFTLSAPAIPTGGAVNATVTVGGSPVALTCPSPNGTITTYACTFGSAQPVASMSALNVTAAQ